MKILIVEDDFIGRKVLQNLLAPYGEVDIAMDGKEGMQAFELAHAERAPYELICLDIMMPNMDGHEALKNIRIREQEMGVEPASEAKIVMTTALDDPRNVFEAYYQGGATGYLAKPINRDKLVAKLKDLKLL
ncbi:MAG: response regulator [Deltaproteobacteria bacterium]|nr:response regulator [Deltaproteobacteria bacterium]